MKRINNLFIFHYIDFIFEMSTIEQISHLIVPFEVEDLWVCTLCEEGKDVSDSIVRHSCGNHLFHCTCLNIRLMINPLCPTCQNLGNGNIAQMNNVKVAVYSTSSNFNEVCMRCLEIIYRREEHAINETCKHRFHKGCTLDLILEKGISPQNGLIFCPLCDSK